jgi:hypothetical protein
MKLVLQFFVQILEDGTAISTATSPVSLSRRSEHKRSIRAKANLLNKKGFSIHCNGQFHASGIRLFNENGHINREAFAGLPVSELYFRKKRTSSSSSKSVSSASFNASVLKITEIVSFPKVLFNVTSFSPALSSTVKGLNSAVKEGFSDSNDSFSYANSAFNFDARSLSARYN